MWSVDLVLEENSYMSGIVESDSLGVCVLASSLGGFLERLKLRNTVLEHSAIVILKVWSSDYNQNCLEMFSKGRFQGPAPGLLSQNFMMEVPGYLHP